MSLLTRSPFRTCCCMCCRLDRTQVEKCEDTHRLRCPVCIRHREADSRYWNRSNSWASSLPDHRTRWVSLSLSVQNILATSFCSFETVFWGKRGMWKLTALGQMTFFVQNQIVYFSVAKKHAKNLSYIVFKILSNVNSLLDWSIQSNYWNQTFQ